LISVPAPVETASKQAWIERNDRDGFNDLNEKTVVSYGGEELLASVPVIATVYTGGVE
jgi:hypothetical protein